MSAYLDAGLIAMALIGVLLVAAFSLETDVDDPGYLALGRWVDLEKPRRWGSRWFVGLHSKTARNVSRKATRIGWVLIFIAGLVQFVRALP